MSFESQVAAHYTHGTLEPAIFEALRQVGIDGATVTPEQLAPVDEFHIGGRQATIDFATQLGVKPGMHLLDIGCGIGGASRYFAQTHGCRVSGIDLTAEFVMVAAALVRYLGLANAVDYRHGSALALPFAPHSFDGAYMLHVGMNIADKAQLCAEVRRVLRPGGFFGIYDVMRTGVGEITYPVPWASVADTSFVEAPHTYKRLLNAAGFTVVAERERRAFAFAFFQQMRARLAAQGPSPLGLHILMGTNASEKVANMVANIVTGKIAPVEIIARASS
jgi:ubiquinone/menaquinone biosynthesis C-methylase UbiE